MPIGLDYTWEETEATLTVTVSVKSVSRSNLDISATTAYLKINAPPHLLLIDLLKDVDSEKSSATIDGGLVIFRCVKKEPGLWGGLKAEGDKEALRKRRDEAMEAARTAAIDAAQRKKDVKHRLDRDSVSRQMDLEQGKRDLIEKRKEDELEAERSGIEAWKTSLGRAEGDDSDNEEGEGEGAGPPRPPPGAGAGAVPVAPLPREGKCLLPATLPAGSGAPLVADLDIDSDIDSEEGEEAAPEGEEEEEEEEYEPLAAPLIEELPPVRARQEPVVANFTELHGKWLPARAQREEEFAELKQKSIDDKTLEDSLDVSERHPVFLKDKGDSLYKQGDYRGAVNAYSRAIDMDPRQVLCFSNRAACYMHMKKYDLCIEDCGNAIVLLSEIHSRVAPSDGMSEEDAAAWRKKIVRVMARRGAAYCEKGEIVEAIRDYEAAWKLEPEDEAIAQDLSELRAALQPADAALLRRRGDARFQAKDADGAVEAYTMLLEMGGGGGGGRGGRPGGEAGVLLQPGGVLPGAGGLRQGAGRLQQRPGDPAVRAGGRGRRGPGGGRRPGGGAGGRDRCRRRGGVGGGLGGRGRQGPVPDAPPLAARLGPEPPEEVRGGDGGPGGGGGRVPGCRGGGEGAEAAGGRGQAPHARGCGRVKASPLDGRAERGKCNRRASLYA